MEGRILIIGAARSGIASAEYLLSAGKEIIVSDMNTKIAADVETKLGQDSVTYIWGAQPDVEALKPEMIVMSPGIPLTIPPVVQARALGIPVISEPELAFCHSKAPFVAITGTNGKTTTTTLTAFLLEQEGRKVLAGGNIGLPLISQCPDMRAEDIVVAEMSSFQLESVHTFRPKVAVIMNLTPDHLDRHKTMEAYAQAKANIFTNQTSDDFLLLNKDDKMVSAMAAQAHSHVYYFTQKDILDEGIWLEDGQVRFSLHADEAPETLINADEIGIVGAHNLQNAMAASLAALLMGQSPAVIAERLREFKGVAHRMEPVATIDDVLYVNDSKGTNPDSTEKALGSYGKRPIVLIAGGKNKGSDFIDLVPLMRAHCRGVVLVGAATGDFIDAFERADYTDYVCADSFEEAVDKAHVWAQPGDVVLLSPACASWDMFDNFEQRGDLFKKLVKDYEGK
ncbi:MAG: UDP-N-acetylmuramoyl-L-alanine--D-glutamate ligase [Peptococcaceae bacterium]|nr:UDP-N-acetylmuramoyl-L-alanine--D-glutamate ligase [Peptococcaceae bacterium]